MAVPKKAIKVVMMVLGVVGTLAMVASVFFRVDFSGQNPALIARFSFQQFLGDLPRHLPWLAAFAGLTALIIPARAAQWRLTLRRPVPFKERYHFVAIGAFVHNALPGKFGDVFRAFLMGRSQRIPFVQSLGSVAVGKLLEFAALMFLVGLSFLGPFGRTMSQFGGALRVAAGICLALVLTVIVLARYAGALAGWLKHHQRLPRLQPFLVHVSTGLGTARSAKQLGWAFLASIPPVLTNALAYGLALRALGVPGGIFAGAVVLGAIALGQAAPGLPAGTGIYYFVTSWSARSLGASPEDAAAFATLTHLGTILTQVSVGAVSVWIRKLRLSDLRRRPGEAVEAT